MPRPEIILLPLLQGPREPPRHSWAQQTSTTASKLLRAPFSLNGELFSGVNGAVIHPVLPRLPTDCQTNGTPAAVTAHICAHLHGCRARGRDAPADTHGWGRESRRGVGNAARLQAPQSMRTWVRRTPRRTPAEPPALSVPVRQRGPVH